jgi:intein-encoded DNA endonuclease-like protein
MDYNFYLTATVDRNEMMRQYKENATPTHKVKVTYLQHEYNSVIKK